MEHDVHLRRLDALIFLRRLGFSHFACVQADFDPAFIEGFHSLDDATEYCENNLRPCGDEVYDARARFGNIAQEMHELRETIYTTRKLT